MSWIRQNFRRRKFTLVFGNDLLGHITDIKLAAGLKGITIRILSSNYKITIYHNERLRVFDEEKISLNAFHAALGIRTRIRTRKPVALITFLEQLKGDAER